MAGAITKQVAGTTRQKTENGDLCSATLDGTNTQQIIRLGSVAEKISYVMNGTLTGTIEFSINGKDWTSAALGATGVMATYSTHLTCVIRVTRGGGSGTVTMAVI